MPMSWWIDKNKLVDMINRSEKVDSWERSRVWFTKLEGNKIAVGYWI